MQAWERWQSLHPCGTRRLQKWALRLFHNLLGASVSSSPWRRRRHIFFTSSMPCALSTARSLRHRSDSCRKMPALLLIRAQMTNGNPKRSLYSRLSRAMREVSAELSASIPAPACSCWDSGVRVPLWRSLPARSGWHLRIPSLPGRERETR